MSTKNGAKRITPGASVSGPDDPSSTDALRALHVLNVYLAQHGRDGPPAVVLELTGGLSNVVRQFAVLTKAEQRRRSLGHRLRARLAPDAREAARKAADQRAQLSAAVTAAQGQLNDLLGTAPDPPACRPPRPSWRTRSTTRTSSTTGRPCRMPWRRSRTSTPTSTTRPRSRSSRPRRARSSSSSAPTRRTPPARAAVTQGIVGSDTKAFTGIAASVAKSYAAMNTSALQWRDQGVAFAKSLQGAISGGLDMLLGPEQSVVDGPKGTQVAEAMTNVATWPIPWARPQSSARSRSSGPPTPSCRPSRSNGRGAPPLQPFTGSAPRGHAAGGLIPTGSWGTVGEIVMEAVRATPAGAEVIPLPGLERAAVPQLPDIVMVMDGYTIGKLLDQGNARQHRSTSLRTVRAT